MGAELTLVIRRILSEPKVLSISYVADIPAAKEYASAKISTELVDVATTRIMEALQQEIAKAREQAIEDVKYAGYGYDDGAGFVLKIPYAELATLKENKEQ